MQTERTLYVFCSGDGNGGEGDEWLQPRPIERAVVDLVTGATGLTDDDLDDLDAYVDRSEVARVLDGDAGGSLTFAVEGHAVTVASDGTIDVDPA